MPSFQSGRRKIHRKSHIYELASGSLPHMYGIVVDKHGTTGRGALFVEELAAAVGPRKPLEVLRPRPPPSVELAVPDPDGPQVAPRAFAKFYTLAEPYIDGSFVESNVGETLIQNYLNFYVYSKIAWDGKIDIDAVLSEHHRVMFGAGAEAMSAFFEALEEKWIGEVAVPSLIGETEIGPMLYPPNEEELWERIYNESFISRIEGYLKVANSAVAAGSIEARRIAWIKSELFDRLAARSRKYRAAISVDVERARRSANPDAVVLVDSDKGWDGWSASKDMVCADGSLKVTSRKNKYIGFRLTGKSALKPNTSYRLSYFLKTENLKSRRRNGGACMEVEQFGTVYSADRAPKSKCRNGTRDWMHQSLEFKTNGDPVKDGYKASLWLRIFNSEGAAWFDGVRLEELKPYPEPSGVVP